MSLAPAVHLSRCQRRRARYCQSLMKMKSLLNTPLAVALALAALTTTLSAAEMTAFQLAKEGDRYVGEQSKGKVVQIHSEKSVGGLVPTVWYVTYFDPDTTFKTVQVKFGAGRKLDQKRPWRMIEQVRGEKVLPADKLKIDSDRAIKIATAEPLLERLKLTATKLELKLRDGEPVWEVEIWAQKLRNPSKDVSLGSVFLNATDGKVTKVDLHINRVD
jgi:uncharacterized membrane protein YkoI